MSTPPARPLDPTLESGAPHPPQERELKFAVAEPLDALRRRLQEVGAHPERPASRECNWVFDRRDELFASSRLLRLRSDGRGSRLTFKGPPRFEADNLKVRDEIEVAVASADQMRDLLLRLGYRIVRRYEKVREEWRLGSTIVALDSTPIGDFVEFEGEEAVAAAERCGYDPAHAERRSYLRLYEDWRREHPETPVDMLF